MFTALSGVQMADSAVIYERAAFGENPDEQIADHYRGNLVNEVREFRLAEENIDRFHCFIVQHRVSPQEQDGGSRWANGRKYN